MIILLILALAHQAPRLLDFATDWAVFNMKPDAGWARTTNAAIRLILIV